MNINKKVVLCAMTAAIIALFACGNYTAFTDIEFMVVKAVLIPVISAVAFYEIKHVKSKGTVPLICVIWILITVLMVLYCGGKPEYELRYMLLSLWPFVCAGLIAVINRFSGVWRHVNTAIYYGVVFVLIWLTQEVIFKQSSFSTDTLAQIYMFAVSFLCLAFYADNGEIEAAYYTGRGEKALVLLVIFISAAVFFITRERVTDIFESLGNSIYITDAEGEYLNWFAQRFKMLSAAFGGGENINPNYMTAIGMNCPLMSLSFSGKGVITVIYFVLLTAVNVLLLAESKKISGGLVKTVLYSFVLKSTLGILAEVMLVFSSYLNPPFISGYDLILLVWLLMSIPEQN